MTAGAVTDMIAPADVQEQAASATRDALAFVEANRVDVVDLATLQQAVQVRAAIGERQKSITAQLSKPKAWAFGLHRWFCSLETAALEPYAKLDDYLSRQIGAFKRAEDDRRREQERALAEERQREEQTRAAAEAAALERAGEHAMAAAVIEESIVAPPPIVALPDTTKAVVGLKFTRRWLWRYAGGPAEVAQTPPAIIARTMQLIPREFLSLDEKKIAAYARSMKASGKIPGIDIYYVDDPRR